MRTSRLEEVGLVAEEEGTSKDELSDAVENALEPARHDAVMSVWQQVVLGRLEHPGTSEHPGNPEADELRRRVEEQERPEDPP